MKPHVFVSSVIDGFEPYREAAAQGISEAGAKPIRVEDVPSQDRTPRNACLDLVEESEIYLVIIGSRGGWTAPSGLKVTEEEYQHARTCGKTILAFVQDVARDDDAERLASAVSDFTVGRVRRTFSTPAELKSEVTSAIAQILPRFESRMTNPSVVSNAVANSKALAGEATVRVAVAPERHLELIDVLDLESEELQSRILEVGHATGVGFFSFRHGKDVAVRPKSMIIEEGAQTNTRSGRSKLELFVDGLILLDTNVRRDAGGIGADALLQHLVIIEQDVADAVARSLRMVNALLTRLDPHERIERMLLNAALSGTSHRMMMKAPPAKGTGVPMRMYGTDATVAFDSPRQVARSEVQSPDALVERVVAMIRRQMNEQ